MSVRPRPRALAALVPLFLCAHAAAGGQDPRADYDVESYALDVTVDPAAERIRGRVVVTARVTAERLDELVLDLGEALELVGARRLTPPAEGSFEPAGEEPRTLAGHHAGDRLVCRLDTPAARGERLSVEVAWAGAPRALDDFDGFHWARTPSGEPWIATSCQTIGAFTWWPCKASFFHPEDKPERLQVDLRVPAGLIGVSNGLLVEREPLPGGLERFRWRLDAPLTTYAVTLNVAPYVELSGELQLDGLHQPVPYQYFVLPEDVEKARLQFADVPAILEAYGAAFGPWPFPEAKVGLVQTPFWGMEHSTAVAYGSSFPAWIAAHGGADPYAARNREFDFILVHELAHEWWGNSVTAADWGDFWLHEGFATYAEGVYVERTRGREAADAYFARVKRSVPRSGSLDRGAGATAAEAYSGLLYGRGAMVLDTLRHYVDDDAVWWDTLRAFQARHRHGNATTDDLRRALEERSGRDWARFFAEWVRGEGAPRLRGSVRVADSGLALEIESSPAAPSGFQVPLDLAWREGTTERARRLWLEPGETRLELATPVRPSDVRVVHLERVLGKHRVTVE